MKYSIKHEIRSRIRVHFAMRRMTFREADTLDYYLQSFPEVLKAQVHERTADAVIFYEGDRARILEILKGFSFESTNVPERVFESSGREASAAYSDRIVGSILMHYGKSLLLPFRVRLVWDGIKAVKYILRPLSFSSFQ